MACNPSVGREYPKNYILLGAITLAMGLSCGVICAHYTTSSVVMVTALTACTVLGLISFAMQTKYDFSGFAPYLWTAFLVLFFTSIMMMFVQSRLLELIYAGCGSLLFSFYIVFDTQQ